MKNGRGDHHDDPKIASLDAARKKQAANQKQAAKAERGVSFGQWIFGALVIAMALGMVAFWSKGAFDAASTLAR